VNAESITERIESLHLQGCIFMKHCTSLFAALLFVLVGTATADAQLYWDTNGGGVENPGAGSGTATWDAATPNWNPIADGTGAVQAWTPDSIAVFAAGGDASTYTVTISGEQMAGGVTFDDPFSVVTIEGGQLTLTGATPTITVPEFEIETINSVIGGSSGLTSAGPGTLILGGANIYTGTTNVSAGNVLRLGAAGAIPDTSVLVLAAATAPAAPATFQMGAVSETVRSITTSGTGVQPTIAIGANTLTLQDDGETQTYTGLYTTTAGGKIIKNGDGTLNLNNFPSNFLGGEFVLNNGVVQVSQNNVFGTTSNGSKLSINGGTLRKAGGAPGSNVAAANVDINNSFTVDITSSNDFQFIGGSAAAAGNMLITLGAENPTITVTPAPTGTSGVFIFAGRVLNGAGETDRGFTKAGQGVLLMGNPHSDYRGETTILEGTLRVRNQFFNGNSPDNNGPARIGDGTGAVNLSGGTLEYNGSPIVEGSAPTQAATGARSITVSNPINVTVSSTINYFSTTLNLAPRTDIDFVFTSNEIEATGGTLSLTNNGSCAADPGCTFRPTFTGSGFDFSQPVVISSHASVASRVTQLVSANTSDTQTWSGDLSGTGALKRTGEGGTTTLTGANTYSGGTIVEGGTLQASGDAATFGLGNITVSDGVLEIVSGVDNAIADTATLTVTTGGMVSLGSMVDDLIAGLTLDSFVATPGTYGSTSSGATNFGLADPNAYFTGTGILTIAAPAGLPGDYTDDGIVDAADYVMWRKMFNPSGPALPNDDTPGVDSDDYDRWVENFGESNAGSGGDSSAPVPEPASIVIVLAVLGAACAVRRRD
jgi:fibronectin-binding autotransporter adhesin